MIESATGIILRTRPLTETSLIVNWLTAEHGRISTVAKGARRPKSAFAGKLDLCYEAEFTFTRSRRSELHALREVSMRALQYAEAVASAAEDVLLAYGLKGYAERWAEHKFPERELTLLRSAIESRDR